MAISSSAFVPVCRVVVKVWLQSCVSAVRDTNMTALLANYPATDLGTVNAERERGREKERLTPLIKMKCSCPRERER